MLNTFLVVAHLPDSWRDSHLSAGKRVFKSIHTPMKVKILLLLLFAFSGKIVFAQANSPTRGAGLVRCHQNTPVYDGLNGKIIGQLINEHNMRFHIKFNDRDSIVVEDCLEMSCCDSYLELLFFGEKEGFINIAKSSNDGEGFWLKENTKDSSVISTSWQRMILDPMNQQEEFFYFVSKQDSTHLFTRADSNSSSETISNNRNWYLKLTGEVVEEWVEVIAIEKKFDPCDEFYYEKKGEQQQDIQIERGYLHLLDNLGLPVIWFWLCGN